MKNRNKKTTKQCCEIINNHMSCKIAVAITITKLAISIKIFIIKSKAEQKSSVNLPIISSIITTTITTFVRNHFAGIKRSRTSKK